MPNLIGVDLNSKFEIKPGLKDINRVKKFIKSIKMKTHNVNSKGFYGEFGGAFIPEMLYPNVEELRNNYLKISSSKVLKMNLINF